MGFRDRLTKLERLKGSDIEPPAWRHPSGWVIDQKQIRALLQGPHEPGRVFTLEDLDGARLPPGAEPPAFDAGIGNL